MAKTVEQYMKEVALKIPEGGSIAWSTISIAGEKLIFGACDKYLYCIDKRDGKLIWKFLTGAPIVSPANIIDDKVFFSSTDKYFYCISLSSGELVWKTIFPEFTWAGGTYVDGILYVGCNDNNLYAVDSENGAMLWSFRTGGVVTSSVAVVNDLIHFGSFD